MKTCPSCSQALPLDSYYFGKNGKPGPYCKACVSAKNQEKYLRNRERRIEQNREYRLQNRESVLANQAAYRERTQYSKNYHAANPDMARKHSSLRRARLRGVEVEVDVTVANLLARDGDKCSYCSVVMVFASRARGVYVPNQVSIDHVVPLASGGGHTLENTVLACMRCNMVKGDREFVQDVEAMIR